MKSDPPTWHARMQLFKRACGIHPAPSCAAANVPPEALPLRAELFSSLQMEQHGRILANAHRLSTDAGADQLLSRLAENESVIIATCGLLTSAIEQGRRVTPAAEWLLDNFYLIEEQIRTAKRHLPKNYSQQLPRLLHADGSQQPRVYDIALETIAHGDGRVDPDGLASFVRAYQQVTMLKLGELWAIPIMLRLALIENLRRVAARLANTRHQRNLAHMWADKLTQTVEKHPNQLILLVADMARSEPPMESAFVAELIRRLQGQSSSLSLPLTWLAQRLAESGHSIEQMVQLESQQQAADQVSMSNCIGSLRLLTSMDWREFVEHMSVVEQCLRLDPSQCYAEMDFATRDLYRHAVEKIGKHSKLSEVEIAQAALELANQAAKTENAPAANSAQHTRQAHIGYYLIGKGLPQLQQKCSQRLPMLLRLRQSASQSPFVLYLGGITLLTLAFSAALLWHAWRDGSSAWLMAWLTALLLLAGSQLALALVNWLATLISLPRPLPRMDFSRGIPAHARTVVVIPSMLLPGPHANAQIDALCEALEVRFLANRDENLRYCLLTDYADAENASQPEDAILLARAKHNIEQLNQRYQLTEGEQFFLFQRPRRWNAQENIWMAYERKRGKLADLNALLTAFAADDQPQYESAAGLDSGTGTDAGLDSGTDAGFHPRAKLTPQQAQAMHAFSEVVGDLRSLRGVRYVITLDTDTELPRDAARKFVATMAHPLNRPRFDEKLGRVVEGYGILQPRVMVSLPGAQASRYELLCGGEAGIDPYTRTVSDVYQDLFGEGSFIGKGIYEVAAFEQALAGKMPENRILSHDLLEGCYARAGLLNDVQLHEQYPSSYRADMRRRHRWTRGDWQLASWLLLHVPHMPHMPHLRAAPKGTQQVEQQGEPTDAASSAALVPAGRAPAPSNPLSLLSRWKLFDNLRRSVVPVALTCLFITSWWLPNSAWWTAVVVLTLFFPALSALTVHLLRQASDMHWHQHLASNCRHAGQHFAHVLLTLTFLPHEAWRNLDAILRTNWRVLVSHQCLLEWTPSNQVVSGDERSLLSHWQAMWPSPALATLLTLVLARYVPSALPAALPILLLWLNAPSIACWISQPLVRKATPLDVEQKQFLAALARRTWLYFETYVTEQDHWLPLDNVQEYPVAVVARRTSPTNIGLSLLANLTAYDFAYSTAGTLLQRSSQTLNTLSKLERYHGHFYNWYDTQYLQPLQPLYISTVDSGNLAGHLLTLRPALLMLADQAILPARMFSAMDETYQILLSYVDAPMQQQLQGLSDALEQASAPHHLMVAHDCLLRMQHSLALFISVQDNSVLKDVNQTQGVAAQADPAADKDTLLGTWAKALARQIDQALDELVFLAPWTQAPSALDWIRDFPQLVEVPTLRQLAEWPLPLATCQWPLPANASSADQKRCAILQELVALGSQRAQARMQHMHALAQQCVDFAEMEYAFLYEPSIHLLAIGFNVKEKRRDTSYYDLLASEARLATFIGIAQGHLPEESWFALGRQLTIAAGEPILLSWSGSMFEYLMPLLVMPNFANTLLYQTCLTAVRRQIEYGVQRGVPWGISESGYNAFDASLNYQYRAFGVPGLGFKRGLGDDLVIAPYASMMALMVAPQQACQNLQEMVVQGFDGKFGFYEAIDYTQARLPRGQSRTLIRSFMTHHQGMGLLSIAHVLLGQPMQARFLADPQLQATVSLLHEKIPKARAIYSNTTELADIRSHVLAPTMALRHFSSKDMRDNSRPDGRHESRNTEVQLLSNGRYHLMLTSAGGSCSRLHDMQLTRWREDSTRDHWGAFCYVRTPENGQFWSNTWQPTLREPQQYEVVFSEGRAEFRRSDQQIDLHTEIVISPEDDIELRRLRITNRASYRRTIEITSYAEIVLSSAAADASHPAFSNLFVQTEILPERNALLCTRRPRSSTEKSPWMFHVMSLHGAELLAGDDAVSFETDRMQFIGRGQTVAAPEAMRRNAPLSNSQGSVLDPIFAIRMQLILEPDQVATIDMVTGVATSRELCLDLVGKYHDRHLAERVVELSWTHCQVMLRQLNASEADAQLYARLASAVFYLNPAMRAEASVLVRNQRDQSGLWSSAISGDLPIVLVQISHAENIELVRQMVQAHAYWRLKGLAVDLVVWNGEQNGYRQVLQEQIMHLISNVTGAQGQEHPGGIFVRNVDQISSEDRILFQAVARVVLSDTNGSLAEQIQRRTVLPAQMPKLQASVPALISSMAQQDDSDGDDQAPSKIAMPDALVRELQMNNGIGGFSRDGREYVICSTGAQMTGAMTPAPWVNILANPHFGSVISESGQAYTWGENAHEFRLTPWSNDPVCDGGGEVFYLRDEESTRYWSPTLLPRRGQGTYTTRHGFGYSVFEHLEDGISTELTVFVAMQSSVKYSVLRVRNLSPRNRKLSATGYVEWVLGDVRGKSAMHLVTEQEAGKHTLLARNPYNREFSQRTAFFDVDASMPNGNLRSSVSITADRREFIGRNRSLASPAAMERLRLSGKVGAGLDPCGALQVSFELDAGQECELVFMLGMAGTRRSEDVSQMLRSHRGSSNAASVLAEVHAYWQQTLGAVQVHTPEPAFDLLANGWLMYQTIACRLWARSGFYQSGGAFGFRDQLQDAMATVHCQPELLRSQLLLCAAHQFVEGDVQHWWHPPANRGVRTHCSDDMLWLPLALERYIKATGDTAVLAKEIPFLEGRAVNQEEDSYYDLPQISSERGSLYQHAVRAIDHSLRYGVHGLALIGSCDWNDGMDKVGAKGQGESVWLSFFLYQILQKFSGIAQQQQDVPFAQRCLHEAEKLRLALAEHGWDGKWYRRAYFDDGSPLGSAKNVECQIDSISQSWAVLSGASDSARKHSAMQSLLQRLVLPDEGIIKLLAPPFDNFDASAPNPGYIRGYVPGVRENGGQYTHAAIWAAMAFADMGQAQQAWDLLQMINPIKHGDSPAAIAKYKVEPYVIAADVYAVAPHMGRGGWTWYTGSAGWMYRLMLESILGLELQGAEDGSQSLQCTPCLPPEWDKAEISYRYRSSVYQIEVRQGGDRSELLLDGVLQEGMALALLDDGAEHVVLLKVKAGDAENKVSD